MQPRLQFASTTSRFIPNSLRDEKNLCQVKKSFSLTYGNKTENLGMKRTTPSERVHSVGLGNILTGFFRKSLDGEKGSQTRKKSPEIIA